MDREKCMGRMFGRERYRTTKKMRKMMMVRRMKKEKKRKMAKRRKVRTKFKDANVYQVYSDLIQVLFEDIRRVWKNKVEEMDLKWWTTAMMAEFINAERKNVSR